MRQGIILVHLDWPWVYAPDEVKPSVLVQCEQILDTLVQVTAKHNTTIINVATPSEYSEFTTPQHIARKLQTITNKSSYQLAAADDLEDIGSDLARKFPIIKRWTIGGFWRDLCCADIKYGVNLVSKAIIPHNWSTFS